MPPSLTWEIKESLVYELDIIFTMLNDYLPQASYSEDLAEFFSRIPQEMVSEIRSILGEGKHFYKLLAPAAYATGTLFEEDFSLATMPIRQMGLQEAVVKIVERSRLDGLELKQNPDSTNLEQFKRTLMVFFTQNEINMGFTTEQNDSHIHVLEKDVILLSRLLKDGDLHARFWHWVDRFYYQIFLPWRLDRKALMSAETERARMALEKQDFRQMVDWLPQSSPLKTSGEIIQTMQTKGLHTIFIVEPFQLPDFWFLIPNALVTSFAEGKDLYRHFFGFMEDLSVRLKALADPTRLAILRIVRSSPQDNTLIATHLGISRPTVSIHAKQLREAGLIKTYEDGRSVRHEVVYREVRRLFSDLERFLDLPPENKDDN